MRVVVGRACRCPRRGTSGRRRTRPAACRRRRRRGTAANGCGDRRGTSCPTAPGTARRCSSSACDDALVREPVPDRRHASAMSPSELCEPVGLRRCAGRSGSGRSRRGWPRSSGRRSSSTAPRGRRTPRSRLRVVADRELVVLARAQPAVAAAAVVLRRARPRTSGPGRGARSPGSRSRWWVGVRDAVAVDVARARPACRRRPAASRGSGRTSGSPSSPRRCGRCRTRRGRAACWRPPRRCSRPAADGERAGDTGGRRSRQPAAGEVGRRGHRPAPQTS